MIGEKNIEDTLKDGLIITIGAAGIFHGLKVANVKPPKASLDTIEYHKTCWWNLWRGAGERLCNPQKMDQRVNTTKIL